MYTALAPAMITAVVIAILLTIGFSLSDPIKKIYLSIIYAILILIILVPMFYFPATYSDAHNDEYTAKATENKLQ